MFNKSVYQTLEYSKSRELSGDNVIKISDDFFAEERTISIGFAKKKIIQAKGTPSEEDLKNFKIIAKKYFYGTIAPTLIDRDFNNFDRANYHKFSNYTMLIDLNKGKDDLWNNLEKKSARWGVKTAEKNGLTFSIMKKEEIDEFYKLYEKTAKDGIFNSEKKEFIINVMSTNIAKLFVIKDKSQIIAGGMILLDSMNKYSILDLTASSEEGMKMQAMPFLYWNLILYSKDQGMRYFDLGGYDKEAKEGNKTYNINKFKERFGGYVMEQPIYSTNRKYVLIRKLLKRLKFMKKIYRKTD